MDLDHSLNKLGRGPIVLVMLHTKYQSSMPCGFRQEDFLCFPYISLCITCNPRDRPFMTHGHNGHNLNKLGRGHLDDAHTKYQIYMACGFRQEHF